MAEVDDASEDGIPTAQVFRRPPALALALVVIALVPRVGYVLANPGGYAGTFAYDPSVYYGSAVAMLHGRWPYADFVLLHPPLAPLVLVPFAAIGSLTRDSVGFALAQVAFAIVGSINAGLVFGVARRFGIGTVGAVLGGLFYALWPGATMAEFSSRLEPLGNCAVLLALLALAQAERTARRLPAALCGAGFGLACCVKVWWLAPLAVVLAWHLTPARRSRLAWLATGAAAPILAVNLPFVLAAPRPMVRMIVTAQLDRPQNPLSFIDRLSGMSGIADIDMQPSLTVAVVATVALAGALAVLAFLSRGHPYGRLMIALTLTTVAVLAANRSYFPFYDDFVAPFLALLIAVAARRVELRDVTRRVVPAAVTACAVATLAVVDIAAPRRIVLPYPAAALRPAITDAHCVMSDSPMALIEMNVLDRDLARGCQNWIDVTGQAFRLGLTHQGTDLAWQRLFARYALSGDAVTLFRPSNTGISPELHGIFASLPRRAISGDFVVYDTSTPLPRRTRRLLDSLMRQP